MILDSSAIVAVLLREPGHEMLLDKLDAAGPVAAGGPTLAEAGIVMVAKAQHAGMSLIARFAAELEVTTIPFDEQHWRVAVDAFNRFGKGRHPARLNFGDCLTYAVASLADSPLLCTGDDFARTDLVLA